MDNGSRSKAKSVFVVFGNSFHDIGTKGARQAAGFNRPATYTRNTRKREPDVL